MTDADYFTSRPVRIVTCSRCQGHGNVTDPYALAPGDRDGALATVPDDVICAFVVGCSDISESCREARDIAKRAKRSVAFEFNGSIVTVRPGDDPDKIVRAWWKRTYGETPEQTRARR